MNAAARALAQGTLFPTNVRSLVLSRQNFGLLMLVLSVLISAFAVVYVKDLGRRFFIELQSMQQAREALQVERSQLLLEQNTWAAQVRVQAIAQQRLDMVTPNSVDVKLLSS